MQDQQLLFVQYEQGVMCQRVCKIHINTVIWDLCIIYVARWDHSFVAAPHVKYVVIVAARSSVQAPLVLSY